MPYDLFVFMYLMHTYIKSGRPQFLQIVYFVYPEINWTNIYRIAWTFFAFFVFYLDFFCG